jgi:type II secretory ATPase GspE/PulE/Tfp pilus assembly ATPase PilB-like protein
MPKPVFAHARWLWRPINYRTFTLGAIQLVNKKDADNFTFLDSQSLKILAQTYGEALYNSKRNERNQKGKFDYLLKNFLITQKELDRAFLEAGRRDLPIETHLMTSCGISREEIGKSIAEFYGVPFISFDAELPVPATLFSRLNPSFMKKSCWVPMGEEDDAIVVAIENPKSIQRIDEIKNCFAGKRIRFKVSLKEDIVKFIDHFSFSVSTSEMKAPPAGSLAKLMKKNIGELSTKDLPTFMLDSEPDAPENLEAVVIQEDSEVAKLVNKMIRDAHTRGASDIHIETQPGKVDTKVRFRIDGTCVEYPPISWEHKNTVVSRIKIMSDLDIAERRKPQDGKIKFKRFGGLDIELRVATIPTQGRVETIALRILADSKPLPLDGMGFSDRNYEAFTKNIVMPYGIIFVCGPTGSGKTTTLHSALGHINRPETKIWTAEDPIEITQEGLSQVQVQPKIGFDFAAALRAFLRADPDVIMVGEMRDKETAQIGIEASLTGHLVFSTLHTNSAPESITRLLNMGMEPFNFADAILCVLAQRLVPTLCPACKRAYQPAAEEIRELERLYGADDFEERCLATTGEDLRLYQPNGCEECNYTGYRGRMGVHELLDGTGAMKKLIETRSKVEDIRTQAIADGMRTLKQDGITKIFQGHTDIRQVRRVCA